MRSQYPLFKSSIIVARERARGKIYNRQILQIKSVNILVREDCERLRETKLIYMYLLYRRRLLCEMDFIYSK